ncbi:RHS repeat-associated core domain-containing protein, partial [Escherichia coli]
TGYCSAQGEQWEYRHDASGRRTEKRCDRKKIRFTYLWDGDSIAEIREYRDDKLYSVRHLVFNGFELISQQCSRVRQPHPSVAPQWVTRTNHAVSDLTGRPLMLFNSEGKTVWRPGQTSLWGLALSLPADTGYPDPRGELAPEADPGLLYAGQWQDAESGLCYNRFRYYEPETGMYLVSDPLGLRGGDNTYAYVPNPNEYIDPLGLATCPIIRQRVLANIEASRAARATSNFGRYKTWNQFQAGHIGQFTTRAEAGKAWEAYKLEHGITVGSTRSMAERSRFLKQLAESGKAPKWMNQWLVKGKVPPGYHVDHIVPISIGGADAPSNMRLMDIMTHTTHHKYYRPWE